MTLSEDSFRERKQALEAYCRDHRILELTQDLVQDVLRERPKADVKKSFARTLRAQLNQEAADDLPGRSLHMLFGAAKRITAEILPKDAIRVIIQETLQLLGCDRVSLFVLDRRINSLVLNASNLEYPIRVKPGQGIAGQVFETRAVINIPDCSKDERFDSSFDAKTGYTTKSLLAMPIIDFDGECGGVLQAINKNGGLEFTREDELVLEKLGEHASICLRNAELYRSAVAVTDRSTALLKMMQALSQDLGVQSTILTVTTHATEVVQADRCTMFFIDEAKQQLWSVCTDSGKEIRIPRSAGIVGGCAAAGDVINVADAYEDPRFNQQVDRDTGYRTRSVLAVPLLPAKGGQAFAVIQMVNKMDFDGEVGFFTDDDVEALQTFAGFVASKLEGSPIFTAKPAPKGEAELAFGTVPGRPQQKKLAKSNTSALIEVTEEEDEEEEGS